MLAPLGADVRGSQFLDPDGTFPAHPPNPEHPAAMAAAAAAVQAAGADLGIVFDTDVDRWVCPCLSLYFMWFYMCKAVQGSVARYAHTACGRACIACALRLYNCMRATFGLLTVA